MRYAQSSLAGKMSNLDATSSGYTGIAVAGAIYGCGSVFVSAVFALIMAVLQDSMAFIPTLMPMLMLWFLAAAILGFLIAAVVGLISLTIVCTFNHTMGYIWNPVTAAGITGGLTGFISTCLLPIGFLVQGIAFPSVLGYLFGPIVAMILGQLLATRGSVKEIVKYYQPFPPQVDGLFAKKAREVWWQFDSRQMFVFTAWCALFSLFVSFLWRWTPVAVYFIGSYFVVQILTYQLCNLMMSGWIQRRLSPLLATEYIDKPLTGSGNYSAPTTSKIEFQSATERSNGECELKNERESEIKKAPNPFED